MADLQMDTIGAPHIVTGADYMDALAKLGWNKENMMSDLPQVTKIASSLTSFMDQQYAQALGYQKTKTDMAESVAKANNYDAVSNRINQELPLSLKQMDLANQKAQNDLYVQNNTLDAQIQEEQLKAKQAQENLRHSQTANPLIEEQDRQKNVQTDIMLDEVKTQAQRNKEAQDDVPNALTDIPQGTDPDFDQKMVDFYNKHPNAATNPLTRDQIQAKIQAVTAQRSQLSSYQEQQANRQQLQQMKARGDLDLGLNIDSTLKSPDDTHAAIARGNVMGKQREVTELMTGIDYTAPAVVQQAAAALKNEQARMEQILSTDDGIKAVARGAYGQYFDANGQMNPSLQGNVDTLRAYHDARVKAGIEKPMETSVKLTNPYDVEKNKKNPEEKTIEHVPLDRVKDIISNAKQYFEEPPDVKAKVEEDAQAKANKDVAQLLNQDPRIQEAYRSGDTALVQRLITEKMQQNPTPQSDVTTPPQSTNPATASPHPTPPPGTTSITPSATNADPEKLDQNLGGALKGHASEFVQAGQKYGVDPLFLAAMSIFETDNGKSHLITTRNNTGGITGAGHSGVGGDYRPFDSIGDSIDEQARLIHHYQYDLGLKTIAQIGNRWAPPPSGGRAEANDPNATNAEWPREVSYIYRHLLDQQGQAASQPANRRRVSSIAEARQLSPGSVFVDPNGVTRRVPTYA